MSSEIQNPTPNPSAPPATQSATQRSSALVYSRKLANPRPMFSLDMTLSTSESGITRLERQWFAVGTPPIAIEQLEWCPENGLRTVSMENPSLQESGKLIHKQRDGQFVLCSPATQMNDQNKSATFKHAPATLLSLPLEVARHWEALKQGKAFRFDYSVLKVQAFTPIRLDAVICGQELIAKVTPIHPFWRLFFGPSFMHFDHDKPVLRKITGLLEPRDKKPNGRYQEYLGSMEFQPAIDLSFCINRA